jgi:hypothetical protein
MVPKNTVRTEIATEGEIGTSHFPAEDTVSVSNCAIITKRQKVQNTGDDVKKGQDIISRLKSMMK